jgi:hypothetical protein
MTSKGADRRFRISSTHRKRVNHDVRPKFKQLLGKLLNRHCGAGMEDLVHVVRQNRLRAAAMVHSNYMPVIDELPHNMCADEARAADDQNPHGL